MTRSPERPTLAEALVRGMRKRCPACGLGKAFLSWFKMADTCPQCGYSFSREEGYWVGALIVNIAVAEAWFALLFAAVVLATMPDVAWRPLLVVGVVTNTLLPALFYPYSKTLWMAVHLHFVPGARSELS